MRGATTTAPVLVEARKRRLSIPFALWPVSAGFPSPAQDYLDRPLDFNELLIVHPAATFAVRVVGNSMTGAGIFPGDIAVVDRALTPADGNIVLAVVDGEFTIKRFRQGRGRVWLEADNPDYQDIVFGEGTTAEIWGRVTHTVRAF
jgi:DNA polymerase V